MIDHVISAGPLLWAIRWSRSSSTNPAERLRRFFFTNPPLQIKNMGEDPHKNHLEHNHLSSTMDKLWQTVFFSDGSLDRYDRFGQVRSSHSPSMIWFLKTQRRNLKRFHTKKGMSFREGEPKHEICEMRNKCLCI